jgi:hypothetical protein
MEMTLKAAKKKPLAIELSIEERIAILHEEIDALVEAHVDKIPAAAPGVPRGVIERLALAHAEGGSGCRCGVFAHLFVPKKT